MRGRFRSHFHRLVLCALLWCTGLAATAMAAPVRYRTVTVDGISIAYREAGDASRPTLLLLHGLPSSSRMYDGLLRALGDSYHLIAPDYPGFGNSAAPPAAQFRYSYDRLASVMLGFADALRLDRYVLFMQGDGAPVGMRMAMARPQAVLGTVFQNGNVHEEGLAPAWEARRRYWTNRGAYDQDVRAALLSFAAVRGRHVGNDPDVEAYDPGLWIDEFAYLRRPGALDIMADLAFDYRDNLYRYPQWQNWLRQRQPPTLVLWGRYDTAFTEAGARAFRRDLPNASIRILDGGHFVMDTRLDDVAVLVRKFMTEKIGEEKRVRAARPE